jgi:TatA/E family protein of Tat protein translocase
MLPTPGPLELVIILVIALLILGPGKLPDVGAALGKSIKEFRKASSDVQEAVSVKVDTSPLPATPAAPTAPDPVVQTPVVQAPIAPAPAAPVAPSAGVESAPAPTTSADSPTVAR